MVGMLGSIGGGALGITGNVIGAAGNIAGSVVGIVGNLAGNVAMSAVRTIAGMAVSAISSVIRLIVSLPGMILGVLQNLLGIIGRVVGTLAGSVLKIAGVFAGLAAGSLLAFGKAIELSAKAALQFAKDAGQLRATTGLSYAGAAGTLRNFGALGIGSESVNGAFGGQNSMVFRMKAGLYGLPGYDDPRFMGALAGRYQGMMAQGGFGQMQAKAMMKSLGLDSPEFLRAAMLSPNQIRSQQGYSQGVYGTLGLNGEALRKYAEDVPLLISRIGIVLEGLKQKLAVTLLPIAERLLGVFTQWAGANADNFGAMIEKGVVWLYSTLPHIILNALQTVIGWAQVGVGALIAFGTDMATRLPQAISAATVAVANLLITFANYLVKAIPAVTQSIVVGLDGFRTVIGGWIADLANLVESAAKEGSPFNSIIKLMLGAIDYTGAGLLGLTKFLAVFGGIVENMGLIVYNVGVLIANMAIKTGQVLRGLFNFLESNPITKAGLGVLKNTHIGAGITGLQAASNWLGQQQTLAFNTNFRTAAQDKGILNQRAPDYLGAFENYINSNGPQNNAQSIRNFGAAFDQRMTGAMNFVQNAGDGAANTLPPLLANMAGVIVNAGNNLSKGVQSGITTGVNLAEQHLNKPLDNLSQFVNETRQKLGTEEQRKDDYLRQIADNTREANEIARQMLSSGVMPDQAKVLAYMNVLVNQAVGRGVRLNGRGG